MIRLSPIVLDRETELRLGQARRSADVWRGWWLGLAIGAALGSWGGWLLHALVHEVCP